MQLTYKLPIDSLNDTFLETVKKQFAGKEVNITIEETKETSVISQKQFFAKMESLRKKLVSIKVDPKFDLSSLTNEVNL